MTEIAAYCDVALLERNSSSSASPGVMLIERAASGLFEWGAMVWNYVRGLRALVARISRASLCRDDTDAEHALTPFASQGDRGIAAVSGLIALE
jgi:hypothetical protein